MEAGIPTRLRRSRGRRFGFTVGGAFLAIALVLRFRDLPSAAMVAGVLGATLVVAAIILPQHLGPVERAWMAFAERLSRITTPIIMAILYYGVVTPVGLLMRAAGRNPLKPASGTTDSYWIARDPSTRSQLTRQF